MTELKQPCLPQEDSPPLPTLNSPWVGRIRIGVLIIFAVLTGYGIYVLVTNDWQEELLPHSSDAVMVTATSSPTCIHWKVGGNTVTSISS